MSADHALQDICLFLVASQTLPLLQPPPLQRASDILTYVIRTMTDKETVLQQAKDKSRDRQLLCRDCGAAFTLTGAINLQSQFLIVTSGNEFFFEQKVLFV